MADHAHPRAAASHVLDLDRPARLNAAHPQQRQARGRNPRGDRALGIGESRQPGVVLRRRAATRKLAVVELPCCHQLRVGIAEEDAARIVD